MAETLKYGGYVNFPLAPADIKKIRSLEAQYVTPEDLLNGAVNLVRSGWGLKFTPGEESDGFKIVAFNLDRVTPDDEHSYYISGESSTFQKALCVIMYKIDSIPKADFPKWVSSKPRGEYR